METYRNHRYFINYPSTLECPSPKKEIMETNSNHPDPFVFSIHLTIPISGIMTMERKTEGRKPGHLL